MAKNDKQEEMRDAMPAVSRRTILKFAAGAPLLLTFGLAASPLARFLKPTMKPGEFFQEADIPGPTIKPTFSMADFPYDWTAIPFLFHLRYVVFNPEQEDIRTVPGFAIRIGDEIVAYSRRCPWLGCHLNFKAEMCCGCIENTVQKCNCAMIKSNPVLVCPNDHSTFDLLQDGKVVFGPARRPPRRFNVERTGDLITIKGLQLGSIA